MKKLSLNIDELSIQSFETMGTPTPRGTVHARRSEIWATCEEGDLSYPGSCEIRTCEAGCEGGTHTTCVEPTQEDTCQLTCEVTAPDPYGTCCNVSC